MQVAPMFECSEIEYGSEQYRQQVALRHIVLREPLGLQYSEHDLLTESDSFHLVCRQGETMVACLIIKPLNTGIAQMRQFAVHPDYQGKGIGMQLLRFAESFSRERGFNEIELHAREVALGFYRKAGYIAEGERFIEVTLPHFAMRKKLWNL